MVFLQQLSGLWYHNRTHHPDLFAAQNHRSSKFSAAQCSSCEQVFSNTSTLQKHTKLEHPGECTTAIVPVHDIFLTIRLIHNLTASMTDSSTLDVIAFVLLWQLGISKGQILFFFFFSYCLCFPKGRYPLPCYGVIRVTREIYCLLSQTAINPSFIFIEGGRSVECSWSPLTFKVGTRMRQST